MVKGEEDLGLAHSLPGSKEDPPQVENGVWRVHGTLQWASGAASPGGARRTSWRGCALSGLEIEAFKMCRKQGQRGLIIVQLHWHLEGIMRKRGPCVADGN